MGVMLPCVKQYVTPIFILFIESVLAIKNTGEQHVDVNITRCHGVSLL